MNIMGKFDGYLICSDCDWTLTDYEKRVSVQNAEAIQYFQENGGLFTVATGRPPHYINHFADSFRPNTFVIAANGTVLYDLVEDKEVYSAPLKRDVTPLLTYIHEHIPGISEVSATNSVDYLFAYTNLEDVAIDPYGTTAHKTVKVSSADDIRKITGSVRGNINRLIFVQKEEDTKPNLKHLREKFPEYKFTQSWDVGLEAQDPSGGKGELILKLKELLPQVHTVIGVGDNDNDITMLQTCDISYAVANAAKHVKEAAMREAPACDQSAIAWIIEDLGSHSI